MTKIIRIVVVGDMHTGSIFGLVNPLDIPQILQNSFSDWIYNCWKDFTTKYNNPDYLLLIGDLADGSDVKALGINAITTDLDNQVKMAKDLLMMLIGDNTKIYGINGSGYHGGLGQGTCVDRRITEALGGEFKGNHFEFDIGNERIQIAHGISGQPPNCLFNEIRRSKEDAQKGKRKGVTILIRGHLHTSYLVHDDANVYAILNGCWERCTPFMQRNSVNKTPSFGATIIDIEDGIVKPYRVDYPLPDSVRQALVGFEILVTKNQTENRKKERVEWENLQKLRK